MNVDQQYLLIKEAVSWVGTPFFDHGKVKGAGVDCVHLVAELYKFLGTINEFNPPPYSMDGGHHQASSQVIEYIQASGAFEQIWRSSLVTSHSSLPLSEPGDLLCFHVGNVEHHTAVQITHSCFIHAVQRLGVILSRLDDSTYRSRLTAIYRPKNL